MAKILVVEDDQDLRDALAQELIEIGHDTISAGNGSEAIDALKCNTIDLVLSDINMPVSNGFDVISWVRNNTAIPIIMMSGYAPVIGSFSHDELNADALLKKPFSPNDLKTITSSLLK